MNEHVVLRHGDLQTAQTLVLAGVDHYRAHYFDPAYRSDTRQALLAAPTDAPVRVLLAHQPRSAQAALAAGFNLRLSGHTLAGNFGRGTFLCR